MITIWNKLVHSLIGTADYSSLVLAILLLKDNKTILQWWQYDRNESSNAFEHKSEKIGLPALPRNEAFADAWEACSTYGNCEQEEQALMSWEETDEEGWFPRHLLEEKYKKHLQCLQSGTKPSKI